MPHPKLRCSNCKLPTLPKVSAMPVLKMCQTSRFSPCRQNLLSLCKSNWNKCICTQCIWHHPCGFHCKIATSMCSHGMYIYSTVNIHTVYTEFVVHTELSYIYSHRFLHGLVPPRHQNTTLRSVVYRTKSVMNCVKHRTMHNSVWKISHMPWSILSLHILQDQT